ncbi:MAG: hypothetical protein SH819_01620 [Cytophagales bacterium]|nr:hypothetical protein [Cytophagales bacterium]
MKTLKFNLSTLTILVVSLFLAGTMSSCGTKSQKEAEGQTEESDHHDKDSTDRDEHHEEGHHQDGGTDESTSETMMWMPGDRLFTGILKLALGNVAKLAPSITSESDGSKVLNLTLTGDKVILLFDGTFENVGANLQFKADGFQGEIALIHHFTNASNFDYVSLNNSSMQLGRIENGKNNVMDKKDKKMPTDWATLTASSAGEHYKGLLNEELVNHGHGDTRPAGQVGLVLHGQGKVMLKMMEVMKLSE